MRCNCATASRKPQARAFAAGREVGRACSRVLDRSAGVETRTLRMQAAVLDRARHGADRSRRSAARAQAPRRARSGAVSAAWSSPRRRCRSCPRARSISCGWWRAACNPISAGLLAPDAQRPASTRTSSPRRISPTPVALAVTLEPEGGVPQPTGEKWSWSAQVEPLARRQSGSPLYASFDHPGYTYAPRPWITTGETFSTATFQSGSSSRV